MLENYAYVLIFLLVPIGFVSVNLVVATLLRPHNPSKEKSAIYDCGEPPVGPGWAQFNMRFYLVALVFVIFDVEIAFMYPVTVVFKRLTESGLGILAFVEIAIFVVILMVGFIYAWSQGGLEWVRAEITAKNETKES